MPRIDGKGGLSRSDLKIKSDAHVKEVVETIKKEIEAHKKERLDGRELSIDITGEGIAFNNEGLHMEDAMDKICAQLKGDGIDAKGKSILKRSDSAFTDAAKTYYYIIVSL